MCVCLGVCKVDGWCAMFPIWLTFSCHSFGQIFTASHDVCVWVCVCVCVCGGGGSWWCVCVCVVDGGCRVVCVSDVVGVEVFGVYVCNYMCVYAFLRVCVYIFVCVR